MPRQNNNKFRSRRAFDKRKGSKFGPRPQNRTPREYQHHDQLTETDVGIIQFISQLEGFSGVIKARFSDFQVNEIDLDGKIAKLTDQKLPEDFDKKIEATENLDEQTTTPLLHLPQEKWNEIKQMLKAGDPKSVELNATSFSKEERGEIHACVTRAFGARKLMGKTVDKDGGKWMIFEKYNPKEATERMVWPKDKGEYVHFILYKECLDTLEAALKIGDCLRISPSQFNYAGVKDKRAKTTQWFSVRKVPPWKLIIKTRCLQNNVKIGNITFKNAPLKLGQLLGNKFRIAIRNVDASDELIDKAMESVRNKGFINYYGLQRFGNDKEKPTFSVGVHLLLGNWKEACELILKPTKADDPHFDVTKAKNIYQKTKDTAKALDAFENSRNTCIEYLLLKGLNKEHSNDYVNALTSIPRNTRLLYLHAFQSLVWNKLVSLRIEKYGLEAVEGDLVRDDVEKEDENGKEEGENDEKDEEIDPFANKQKVKALTASDLPNYTIYDIVLPLPGYDVTYPENMKESYKEILESYGLSLEMAKQKVQAYSLSGNYRKIVRQVQDLSWKTMKYNDPTDNLIRSDLEELRKAAEPTSMVDGKYKALVLEFGLHSSCYATMVIREILKTDTSSSSHAKLNNYAGGGDAVKKIDLDGEGIVGQGEPELINDRIGLLEDEGKFEAFKRIVFDDGLEDGALKRAAEDEGGDAAKKAKLL